MWLVSVEGELDLRSIPVWFLTDRNIVLLVSQLDPILVPPELAPVQRLLRKLKLAVVKKKSLIQMLFKIRMMKGTCLQVLFMKRMMKRPTGCGTASMPEWMREGRPDGGCFLLSHSCY